MVKEQISPQKQSGRVLVPSLNQNSAIDRQIIATGEKTKNTR